MEILSMSHLSRGEWPPSILLPRKTGSKTLTTVFLVSSDGVRTFWGRHWEPAEPKVQVPSLQASPADPQSCSRFSPGCAAAQPVHPALRRHAAPACHRLVPGRTPKNRGVREDGSSSRSQYSRLRGVVGAPAPLPSQLSHVEGG